MFEVSVYRPRMATVNRDFLTICPHRHPLGAPGTIRVGWRHCVCPTGRENGNGHTIVTCEACRAEGRTTVMYQPEHIRTAEEVEGELRWVRVNLEQARAALETLRADDVRDWRRDRLEGEVARLERTIVEGERVIEARRAVEAS